MTANEWILLKNVSFLWWQRTTVKASDTDVEVSEVTKKKHVTMTTDELPPNSRSSTPNKMKKGASTVTDIRNRYCKVLLLNNSLSLHTIYSPKILILIIARKITHLFLFYSLLTNKKLFWPQKKNKFFMRKNKTFLVEFFLMKVS